MSERSRIEEVLRDPDLWWRMDAIEREPALQRAIERRYREGGIVAVGRMPLGEITPEVCTWIESLARERGGSPFPEEVCS